MSLKVESETMVTFPNQQMITDYMNSHPLKITGALDTPIVKDSTPDSFQKVAQYFADKKMPFSEIRKNVKEVLTDQKLARLTTALRKLTVSWKNIDAQSGNQPDALTARMADILSQTQQQSSYVEIVVELYAHVLRDLLDKATFTPPIDGSEKWTRHVVEDLTIKKETSSGFIAAD
jgi:hypothetical protein